MSFMMSPQTGKTLLTMVFTIILCSLLVTPMVIALEFDNVATYNEETKVYTIENAFGLGEKIAEIELITPQIFSVGLGYQYVAEFELRDYDILYGNAFQDMNFYQINNGMNEFTRDFEYRYLTYETDVRETYGEVCENGNCSIQEIGEEEYQKEIWTKFSDVNELPQQDNIRIRIYTDVKNKDYVEWIPTMYGEYLEEWAVWSGNLSSSLTSYYFFNDTTGNLIDYVGSADFTETGTVGSNSSGIIGNSRGDYSDANYFTNTNATEFATGSAWALSFWYNVTTNSASSRHMFTSHPDDLGGWTDTFEIYVDINSDEKLFVNSIYRGSSSDTYTGDLMNDSEWHHVIVSQNASGAGVQVYVDGVWKANLAFGGSKANPSIQKEFGQILSDGPAESADGIYLDEAGIWSRGLTSAEASILWNDGDGCEYNDEDCLTTPITITDISPVNTTNSTVSSVTLGVNVTDDSAVTKVYLYIDGSLNNTNSSGVNGIYNWTYNFADGSYTWYVIGEDDEGTNTTMATYNFSVDTIFPSVVLNAPSGKVTNNGTFNFSATSSDTNLDTCWYSYNGTNTTYTCNNDINVGTLSGASIYACANDTVGNENCTSPNTFTWDITINVLDYNGVLVTSPDIVISDASIDTNENPLVRDSQVLLNNLDERTMEVNITGGESYSVDYLQDFEFNTSQSTYNFSLDLKEFNLNFTHLNGSFATVNGYWKDNETLGTNFTDDNLTITLVGTTMDRVYIQFGYNLSSPTDYRQYYEFDNDYSTAFDVNISVIDALEDTEYYKILDEAGNPVQDVTIRVYQQDANIGGGTWNLMGQRFTGPDGFTFFYFDNNTDVYIVASKDGYTASDATWNVQDETNTKDDPKIIVLEKSDLNTKDGVQVILDPWFVNRTSNKDVFVYAPGRTSVTFTTDYKINAGHSNRTFTLSSLDTATESLVSGQDYNATGDSDITLYIWVDGSLWGEITIDYRAGVVVDLIDETDNIHTTTRDRVLFILLVLIAGVSSFLMSTGERSSVGKWVFIIGAVVLGSISYGTFNMFAGAGLFVMGIGLIRRFLTGE